MRFLIVFLTVLTLITLSPADAKAGLPEFQWGREIDLPEISKTTLVGIPLDSHFFEFTRENWPDVRLKDTNGDAIGWSIQTAKTGKPRTIRRFWPVEKLTARVSEAGLQVEFELAAKDPLPSGVRILTPLRDFEHQVQRESSLDGQSWVTAGSAGVIFDYSRHVDARNDLVPLSSGDHRRFRLTITDLTAEQDSLMLELQRRLQGSEEVDRTERTLIARRPFRIDQIQFYRDELQAEQRDVQSKVYPAIQFGSRLKTKEHQTILEFGSRREPITEIKIITKAENFSRAVTVEAEDVNENTEWRAVASGTLTRFDVGTIHREEVTSSFPEHRCGKYRVIIENRDSPPLDVTGVELSGPVYELAFLASPGQKAILEYGSFEAKAGQYDKAALQAVLAEGLPATQVSMQDPHENSNAPKTAFWMPWNDTRVLVGSVIVLTLMLAWGLFGASRRLSNLPADRDDSVRSRD